MDIDSDSDSDSEEPHVKQVQQAICPLCKQAPVEQIECADCGLRDVCLLCMQCHAYNVHADDLHMN